MEGATSRPRTDKGPSDRACARYRRILLSLRLWGGDSESKQCAQGPLPWYVSPSLPVKAGHQDVVTTTDPNQARSASPLRTWALLHGMKVTLLLRESWGCSCVPTGRVSCPHPQLPSPSAVLGLYLLRLRAAPWLVEPYPSVFAHRRQLLPIWAPSHAENLERQMLCKCPKIASQVPLDLSSLT